MATSSDFANRLLEQYKKIYFDAKYYLKQSKAIGRDLGDLTKEEAWNNFSTEGYKLGINPSKYFDVKRYYQENGVSVTDKDPISHYTEKVALEYQKSDPADTVMPITPKRVGLGMTPLDATKATAASSPVSHLPVKEKDDFAHNLQWFPLGIVDGFPKKAHWSNWNYIGLTQGNVLYYSFDKDNSWAIYAANNYITNNFVNKDGNPVSWPDTSTYLTLDTPYRDYCRTIFSMLSAVTGINFEETSNLSQSNIHFFSTDTVLLEGHDAVGIAELYPDRAGTAIIIDNKPLSNTSNSHPHYKIFTTLAHEVGYALGLQHPHDENTEREDNFHGDAFNTYDYTVMGYTWLKGLVGDVTEHGGWPVVYGPRDILALQDMYGTDGLNGEEGLVYSKRQKKSYIWSHVDGSFGSA